MNTKNDNQNRTVLHLNNLYSCLSNAEFKESKSSLDGIYSTNIELVNASEFIANPENIKPKYAVKGV